MLYLYYTNVTKRRKYMGKFCCANDLGAYKLINIPYRKVEDATAYGQLERDIKDEIDKGKLNEYKMETRKEIEKIESEKERSLSMNFPLFVLFPSAFAGVIGGMVIGKSDILKGDLSIINMVIIGISIVGMAILSVAIYLVLSAMATHLLIKPQWNKRREKLFFLNIIKDILEDCESTYSFGDVNIFLVNKTKEKKRWQFKR